MTWHTTSYNNEMNHYNLICALASISDRMIDCLLVFYVLMHHAM